MTQLNGAPNGVNVNNGTNVSGAVSTLSTLARTAIDMVERVPMADLIALRYPAVGLVTDLARIGTAQNRAEVMEETGKFLIKAVGETVKKALQDEYGPEAMERKRHEAEEKAKKEEEQRKKAEDEKKKLEDEVLAERLKREAEERRLTAENLRFLDPSKRETDISGYLERSNHGRILLARADERSPIAVASESHVNKLADLRTGGINADQKYKLETADLVALDPADKAELDKAKAQKDRDEERKDNSSLVRRWVT